MIEQGLFNKFEHEVSSSFTLNQYVDRWKSDGRTPDGFWRNMGLSQATGEVILIYSGDPGGNLPTTILKLNPNTGAIRLQFWLVFTLHLTRNSLLDLAQGFVYFLTKEEHNEYSNIGFVDLGWSPEMSGGWFSWFKPNANGDIQLIIYSQGEEHGIPFIISTNALYGLAEMLSCGAQTMMSDK